MSMEGSGNQQQLQSSMKSDELFHYRAEELLDAESSELLDAGSVELPRCRVCRATGSKW